MLSVKMSRSMIVLGSACALMLGCQGKTGDKPASGATAKSHWSYEGSTGPANWGSLDPAYALCSTGKKQSPINLNGAKPEDLPNLSFHYNAVPVDIVNNGHAIQVNYAAGSYMEVEGERYNLLQFHFHSPSEHLLNGRHAAAEMHLVHKSASGGLAVVAVMLDEGAYNTNFEPVWKHLPAKVGPSTKVNATIDVDDLLPADQRTYRYDGSLTTPPGTEGVRWYLMTRPVELSSEQLTAFRKIFYGNNRPVQPLNGRVIIEDTTR